MGKHGPYDFGKLVWASDASWVSPRYLAESYYGRTVDDIRSRIQREDEKR